MVKARNQNITYHISGFQEEEFTIILITEGNVLINNNSILKFIGDDE